jgi:peptide/nickel transport system permease protein
VKRPRGRVRTGLLLIGVIGAVAALAPMVIRRDPAAQPDIVRMRNAPPSLQHPLGTDFLSRDVLTRVLHGARLSLSVAVVAVLVSLTVGTTIGLIAGFGGGITDILLMRMVDTALAIPRLFLLLVVVALWQHTGIITLILILGLTSWFETSRLVRAEVMSVKRREYVAASRSLGIPVSRLLLRHVLPNVLPPILAAGSLGVANMILIEAGLSYLGFGIAPPAPTLGNMMREGKDFFLQAPWTAVGPGVVVALIVLAFAILSEGLREANDPRVAAP